MFIFFLLITLIVFWAIIHFALVKTTIKGKRKRLIASLIVFLLPILVFLSIYIVKGFIPLPKWFRKFSYSVYTPIDLLEPIITDKIDLSDGGFTKTYQLRPRYQGTYWIVLDFESGIIPQDDDVRELFDGKIKAEFFWKDKFLFEKVTSPYHSHYVSNHSTKQVPSSSQISDMSNESDDVFYLTKWSLVSFDIPFDGKYIDDISVKLTILKPYKKITSYEDSFLLKIEIEPYSTYLL